MLEQIITYGIIAGAACVAIIRVIRVFKKRNNPCSGCGSECQSCTLVDLKKKIEMNEKKKKQAMK